MISQVLRTKAERAKHKLELKKQHDKDCDINKYKINNAYKVHSFQDYLQNFMRLDHLDKEPQGHGRVVEGALEQIAKDEYIYLKDEHAHLSINQEWLRTQNEYIASLNKEQMFDLYGYTYRGDVFVNNYTRGTFDIDAFKEYLLEDLHNAYEYEEYFPLFFPALQVLSLYGSETMHLVFDTPPSEEEIEDTMKLLDPVVPAVDKYIIMANIAYRFSYERFWVSVLETYKDRIEKLIRGSPATTERMVLYRGAKNDYFLSEFMLNHRQRIHVANSFVSTTSAITVLKNFVNKSKGCCVMRLYVPVGTHALLLHGLTGFGEAEFLLGHKTQFYITKSSTEKFCTDKVMRVSDLVVIQ